MLERDILGGVVSRSALAGLPRSRMTELRVLLSRLENDQLPVSLPREILSIIFGWLAKLEPLIPNPPLYAAVASHQTSTFPAWTKVSFVCNVWREEALANKVLWADGGISSLDGMKWFRKRLEYAGWRPVAIVIRADETLDQTRDLIASCDLTHMESLCVLAHGSHNATAMPFHLHALYPPTLRRLHMHFEHRGEDLIVLPEVPEHRLVSDFPHLRDVYMHNVIIDLKHRLLVHQLTHLSLTVDQNASSALIVPPSREIIDLLHSQPALESFTFQGWMPVPEDEDVPTHEDRKEIICPNLRHVLIDIFNPPTVLILMSRLVPAQTARMTFVAWDHATSLQPVSGMVREAVARRMLSQINSPLLSMKVAEWLAYAPHWSDQWTPLHTGPVPLSSSRAIVFSAWREGTSEYLKGDLKGYQEPPPPDFQLIIGMNHSGQSASDEFSPERLIPFEAFAGVECISFRERAWKLPETSPAAWQSLFREAGRLEWLRADRLTGWGLLRQGFNALSATGGALRILGTVKRLVIMGIDWADDEDVDDEEVSPPAVTMLRNLLLSEQTMVEDITVGPDSHAYMSERVGETIGVHQERLKGAERRDDMFHF
ncbi:unnamed protein product [Peniophora sp. CBMAI 1063]|nr:unnamed protein product [Peniophora sp. CBMAI 1063]